MPSKKSTLARTHTAARHIIHSGKSYYKGDPITFGPETSDEDIQELLDNGTLQGLRAEELEREQIANEIGMKISGMSVDDQKKLFRLFDRKDLDALLAGEHREARIKEDADDARRANLEETAAKTGPDDEEATREV